MRFIMGVAVGVGVLLMSACSGRSAPSMDCVPDGDPAVLATMKATTAFAVDADAKLGDKEGYYVAADNGSLWIADLNGGVLLPLTDLAKAIDPAAGRADLNGLNISAFAANNPRAQKAQGCLQSTASS